MIISNISLVIIICTLMIVHGKSYKKLKQVPPGMELMSDDEQDRVVNLQAHSLHYEPIPYENRHLPGIGKQACLGWCTKYAMCSAAHHNEYSGCHLYKVHDVHKRHQMAMIHSMIETTAVPSLASNFTSMISSELTDLSEDEESESLPLPNYFKKGQTYVSSCYGEARKLICGEDEVVEVNWVSLGYRNHTSTHHLYPQCNAENTEGAVNTGSGEPNDNEEDGGEPKEEDEEDLEAKNHSLCHLVDRPSSEGICKHKSTSCLVDPADDDNFIDKKGCHMELIYTCKYGGRIGQGNKTGKKNSMEK